MAMTAAERRRKERERKRDQRAAARAEGRPELAVVNAAIVEAVSYVLLGVNIGLKQGERAKFVNTDQVGRVALRILCVRRDYDFEICKAMIIQALGPREEHRWASYMPTWHHVLHPGSPPGEGAGMYGDASAA